jgi:hypothetical protein
MSIVMALRAALLLTLLLVHTQITNASFAEKPTTPDKSDKPEKNDKKTPVNVAAKELKILFVGNSFTFWNGGLDQHLKILSDSVSPPLNYKTESVVKGGASLEVMWNKTKAVEKIKKGGFNIVVLQEDIPETNLKAFREYSKKFVDLVRKSGARPILFMAWDYERLNWISMDQIIAAHKQMAKTLKVEVAPVGLAWSLSKKRQPGLNMYAKDAEHPSVAGMYLSLMVIESTISGKDPLTRDPKSLPIEKLDTVGSEVRRYLREVARDSIRVWKKKLSR